MIIYKNINWYNYQGALLPKVDPNININLDINDRKFLIKKSKRFFIRWTDNWDTKKKTNFWYIIKDSKEDISLYKSKIRNQINKGLKNCIVKKVSNEFISKFGYTVYSNAFKNYNTNIKPVIKTNFMDSIKNSKDDFFGVFNQEEKLIGYSQNIISSNIAQYSVIKLDPDYLSLYPSYALIFEMNRYYLNEKNFLFVSDGARSLSHDTNIQDFLIQKFKFRKAYCNLNIEYRNDIKIFVKFIYPYRRIFYNSKYKILKKIGVLLKHEEFRR